jgi:hypothetical protein
VDYGWRAASDTSYIGLQIAGGPDDSGVVSWVDINGGARLALCDGETARPRYGFDIARLTERQRGGR